MQVGLSHDGQKARTERRSTPRPKQGHLGEQRLLDKISAKATVRKRRQSYQQSLLGTGPQISAEELKGLRLKTNIAFWLVFATFLGAQNVWAILASAALFGGLSGILDYLSFQPTGPRDTMLGRGTLKIMGALTLATGVIILSGLNPGNGIAFVITGGLLLLGTFAIQEWDQGKDVFRYVGDLVAIVMLEARAAAKAGSNWCLAATELAWEELQKLVGQSLDRAAHTIARLQEQAEPSSSGT